MAEHIDPTYAESVKIAANAGVTVLAASCIIDEQKILLKSNTPFDFIKNRLIFFISPSYLRLVLVGERTNAFAGSQRAKMKKHLANL